MQGWRKISFIVAMVLALVAAGGIGFWIANRNTSTIPSSVQSKLTFSPITLPANTKAIYADNYKFSKAEDNTDVLSFIIHINNTAVSVTEYVQPKQFVEVPEYKDRFLNNVVNQNSSVQTANGVIYLGQASKQNNKQIGVMLERGLLIFFNPDRDLQEETWRQIGDSLEIEKTTR